jgi:hypothetical protein
MESERQKGSIQVTALGYFFLGYGYSAVVGRVPLFNFKGGFKLWQREKPKQVTHSLAAQS